MKKYYETHKVSIEGEEHTLFRVSPTGNWKYRWWTKGKADGVTFKTTNVKDAERSLRDHLKALAEGRGVEAKAFFRQREAAPPPCPQLKVIIEAYRIAPAGPLERTRRENITALGRVITTALGDKPAWMERPWDILTAKLIREYKNKSLERARGRGVTGADLVRVQSTADDTLRQGRSIFSIPMIEHYREDRDFKLPDIESFRRAPGFRARKIQAYQRPSDDIVDRLFSELEASKESEPERYLICWLAITFGLRKSEIAACKSDWFIPIKGRTHIEIRAVETKSATRDYTKNGQAKPCSSAGLGGWEKIKPMIQAMEPGQYLIQGSRSYRTDVAFRKINKWLRQLGWRTFKVIHELRKLAGSEMIMKSGIYAASQFLRHGNISTTQKFYGKYADVTISDEPIKPRNRVPNQVPNDAVLDAVTPIPDSDLTGISEVPGGDKTGQSAPTQTTDSDGVINVIT